MARGPSLQNLQQYHKRQMEALNTIDLPAAANRFNLQVNNQGQISIKFFGRDYLIANKSIEAHDGQALGLDHQSIMAHYLCSEAITETSGEFVPISRLTGIPVTGKSPSDHLIESLTLKFGDNYELFKEAALKIGGQNEGKSPSGAESWLFNSLIKLPLKILFFQVDDEFPAEVKVLFDSSAAKLVEYECLELIEIVLVMELLSAAGLIPHTCAGMPEDGTTCSAHANNKCDCGHHHEG